MSTVIGDQQQDKADRHQRWERLPRAELLRQHRDVQVGARRTSRIDTLLRLPI